MKIAIRLLIVAVLATLCVFPGGCLFKPTTMPTRSFVLTSLPAPGHEAIAASSPTLGVGLIKMPAYLMRTSMAVRKTPNEIIYLENALWAERLDRSFQRTLGANLAALVPTEQIRLSSWGPGEVALTVRVSVEQFDVDSQGLGLLTAWWWVTNPTTDKVVRSGECRLSHQGAPPQADPQNIATTLSTLTADLSRTLAQAVVDSTVPGAARN